MVKSVKLQKNKRKLDNRVELEEDEDDTQSINFPDGEITESSEDEEESVEPEDSEESDEPEDSEESDESEDSEESEDTEGSEEEDEPEDSDEPENSGELEKPTDSKIETITSGKPSNQPDEYAEGDTSDEEDIRNTIGNVPKNWYDEYKHFGYNWDGERIIKPTTGDRLDAFLKRIEDPDFWRTVQDPQTGQNVILSDEDIDIIKRIQTGKIPDVSFDDYAPWIEWFTREIMVTPIRKFPEHKRSFLPSRTEKQKISRIVHSLKMGWMKTIEETAKERAAKKGPKFYDLWGEKDDETAETMRGIHKHIPPPKRALPGHAESYNPPPEFLFDELELKEWHKHKGAPWRRKLHFIPEKYGSLRQVPAYPRFIKERFIRCLDLYLCPRGYKMRYNVEPESLVPKLPEPRDLQPFPNYLALEFKGHTNTVRCLTCEKTGQYLASGSEDGSVKIWEINTGRCLKTLQTEGVVRGVDWCPNASISLILIASDKNVYFYNPRLGDHLITSKTDEVLRQAPVQDNVISDRIQRTLEWDTYDESSDEYGKGLRLIIKHFKEVSQSVWHGRGDYFATVLPDGANRSVIVGQLSKRRSQIPFSKSKGLIQKVLFHPTKPYLFVATQRHVRIYDLVGQNLMKKLMTNAKWVSSIAIHPAGDNLLVGTYDRKILWFDLDLSTKPYQTLRLHGTAVRAVAYHKRYPLFVSAGDDRTLIVCHGMVYNDLLKNPLIVPLKRLDGHKDVDGFGVFDVIFHPLQPWVFSAGADSTIKMYCN